MKVRCEGFPHHHSAEAGPPGRNASRMACVAQCVAGLFLLSCDRSASGQWTMALRSECTVSNVPPGPPRTMFSSGTPPAPVAS